MYTGLYSLILHCEVSSDAYLYFIVFIDVDRFDLQAGEQSSS